MTRILVATELAGISAINEVLSGHFELHFPKNSAEALKMAITHKPALVICDILFDESNVFALLESLKEEPSLNGTSFLCAQIQPSGMPAGLVSSFEIVCSERSDCMYLDILRLLQDKRAAELPKIIKNLISGNGFSHSFINVIQ